MGEAMGRPATALETAISAIAALAPGLPSATSRVPEAVYTYDLDAGVDTPTYHLWLELHAERRRASRQKTAARLATVDAPKISVVVPVYRPQPEHLRACVGSVLRQSYGGWELVLCDDASDDDLTSALLDEVAALDDRIVVVRRDANGGISRATNDAAKAATGDFLAFLDQDDEIEEGVLGDVAEHIVDRPDADVLYTDQDKLDEDGIRSEPYFKPGWSPDLLLSNMYMAHLLVVRRSLFEQLGGFRPKFDGSQDYDLALRATEVAREVVHVPVVGYHWRRTPGSTALDYGAKPQADIAAREALADAMRRRGEDAVVEDGLLESTFRVRRRIVGDPLVSVIVPFHDGARLLRKCVDSFSLAGYDRWELLLVDNRSWEPETVALLRRFEGDERIRVLEFDAPFNWSAINNWAAERANGDHLLFMNSDVEGRSEGWLAAMVEHSQRREVGAVGARLLYPDGSIQHAGAVLGLGGGVAWHAFCFCPPHNNGYFGHTKITRNYSAVTGACLMTRRDVFEEVGRFDEEMPVAFNDIDFCLRVRSADRLVVYTPFAELVHYEGATRGRAALEREETREMFRRWEPMIRRDPYFNPNLNPLRSEFQLSIGTEEVDPWERLL